MDWSQILVIILSVALAVFLILAIVLTMLLIRVTVQIKAIAATAGRAAHKFESVAENVARYSSPMAIFNLVSRFIRKNKSKKRGNYDKS